MPLSRITSPFQSATANVYSPSANTIAFRTSSTDRLRINSDGNTVTNRNINITSDDNEFAANTNGIQIQPQGRIFIDSSADWLMELSGNTTSRVRIYSSTGGQSTTVGSITASATSALFNAGSVQLNANGITFPASQNASSDPNTLDDYEEGTWTPTISIEGGSGALSATSIYDARYTKIGRLVHVTCDVAWSNYYANGGTGAVLFTGLPFAYAKGGTQGEGQLMQGGYWTFSNITGSRFSSELIWHTFFNTSGSTGGYIKYKASSTDRGSYLALDDGPLGTGSGSLVFQFEFTYVAAT
jgi:hypothetical protein